MLKYHTIDISCRAIPNEVCLVFNITGCTIKCPGCNERTLWKDKGTPLTFNEVRSILKNFNSAVTCVCFMGGEHEPQEINNLARFVKHNYPCLRTAWYSGLNRIPRSIEFCNFNYLKTGAYEASKGVLGEQGTNQRVFMVSEDCSLTDITDKYLHTAPIDEKRPDMEPVHEENVTPEEDTEENSTTDETDEETAQEYQAEECETATTEEDNTVTVAEPETVADKEADKENEQSPEEGILMEI